MQIEQLPKEIRRAFSHGFVFMITPDLIQHFPARGWTDEEILASIHDRYQEQGTFKNAGNYRIIELSKHPDVLIVVP